MYGIMAQNISETARVFEAPRAVSDQFSHRRTVVATADSTPALRRCTKCERELPPSLKFFHRQSTVKSGLMSQCRECVNAATLIRNRERFGYKPRRDTRTDVIRTCTSCKQSLPQTLEFFRFKKIKDIFNSQCRSCEATYKRQRRADPTSNYAAERTAMMLRNHKRLESSEAQSENRERTKAWYHANKERSNQRSRERAINAKLRGSHSSEEVKTQYDAQDGKCHWCGSDLCGQFERDHIIPISRGGVNTISNIVCACAKCNRSKGAKLPSEWKGRLS